MKKCPYCAESIQDEAIKCRYCGEFLEKKPQVKWYFRTSVLIIAFLCFGPLALPLLWINPRYSKKSKIIVSIIIIIISYYLLRFIISTLKRIEIYYQQIFQI